MRLKIKISRRITNITQEALTNSHEKAINMLLKDENLLITNPNNRSRVPLLSKGDQIDKISKMMNGKLKFQKLTNLKDLKDSKFI